MVATSAVADDALDRLEVALVLWRIRLVRLDVGRSLWQGPGLQDAAAVVTGATIVEALADDLASLDDDAAMAVVKSGQGSLVKTKIQILIGLHCCGLRSAVAMTRLGIDRVIVCLRDRAMLNVGIWAFGT